MTQTKQMTLAALAALGLAAVPVVAAHAEGIRMAQATTAPRPGTGPMVTSPPGAVPATGAEQGTRTTTEQQRGHVGHSAGQATPHVTTGGNPTAQSREGGAQPHNAFPAGTHAPVGGQRPAPHVTTGGNPVTQGSEGGAQPHNAFPPGTHAPVRGQ